MSSLVGCETCGQELEMGVMHDCRGPGQVDHRKHAGDLPGATATKANSAPTRNSSDESQVPEALRVVVQQELSTGENVLWLGRPSPNASDNLPKQFFLYASLGLMGVGMGVAAIGSFHAGPLVVAAMLTIFGLVLMIPWFTGQENSCRACYVVTNRRVMLVELPFAARKPIFRSYLPHQLVGMERRDNPKLPGNGDLIFEYYFALPGQTFDPNTMSFSSQNAGFGRSDVAKRVPRGFLSVDNVREIEHLVRTTHLTELEEVLDQSPGSRAVCADGAPSATAAQSHCSGGQLFRSENRTDDVQMAAIECRQDGQVAAEIKAKALAELDPNEKVVWISQPVAKLLLVRSGLSFVGGLVGFLIALTWLVITLAPPKPGNPVRNAKAPAPKQAAPAAAAGNTSTSNLLLPAGLLLLSGGFMLAPFARCYTARRTCYAVTNRRALVYKEGLFGTTRESYGPLELANMRRSNSWVFRGSGDLIFRTVKVVSRSQTSPGKSTSSVKTTHYGFLAIEEVEGVDKLIRETLLDRFVERLQRASAL